jgi:hypothetical protein
MKIQCLCAALLLLVPSACARRVVGPPAGVRIPEITSFHGATRIQGGSGEAVFVLHTDPEAKGTVSEQKKGTITAKAWGIENPRGFCVDPRRAQFYVLDGSRVAIFPMNKPGTGPQVIVVPALAPLTDIAFSIMNRRAYVASAESRSVWQVNPVNGSVQRQAGPEVFEEGKWGKPSLLIASVDGMRLYIVTSGPSQLVALELREGKLKLMARLPELAAPSALDLYKNHFIVADAASGRVFAVERSNFGLFPVILPQEAGGRLISAAADSLGLTLLVKEGEGDQEKVIHNTKFKLGEPEAQGFVP